MEARLLDERSDVHGLKERIGRARRSIPTVHWFEGVVREERICR